MPRRKKRPVLEEQRTNAAKAITALVGPPREKKTKRPHRIGKRGLATAMDHVQRRIEEDDWAGATVSQLVALYAVCHEDTYGVSAVGELTGNQWLGARAAASKMLREEFDNDLEAVVEFLRWTWRREVDRENWRRANGRQGGRITWRAQFQARALLTEYRIDMERRRG